MPEPTPGFAAAWRASMHANRLWLDAIGHAFGARAWPSYVLIWLVQIKILWRIWSLRDVTGGDTSSYFESARRWADSLAVNFAWSPAYTAFYGSFLWIVDDPVAATIMHRFVIVMLATTGVLFVARLALSAPLALLVALWWAVLPINFETLYEVHLFALLPILAAWALILGRDSAEARGAAIAILIASAVLVRNEFAIAAAVMFALCAAHEWRARQRTPRELAWAYGLPAAAAVTTWIIAYWRSFVRFPALWGSLDAKHTVNMCQVFAFGHQQRDPTWTASPWTQCYGLMREVFGLERPTLGQMIANNFDAAMTHFWWNLGLLPNGLQVLLFNAMSGTVNPDYAPVRRAVYPLVLSILVIVVLAAGAVLSARAGRLRAAITDGSASRLAISFLPFLVVLVPVVLTQRPRPSYLFYVSVMVMIATLAALGALVRSWRVATRVAAPWAIALAVGLIAFHPGYYVRHPSARPLATKLQNLMPHRDAIAGAPGVILGEHAGEIRNFLTLRGPARPLLSNAEFSTWDRTTPIAAFLAARGVTLVYLDPHILANWRALPAARDFLADPAASGWAVIDRDRREPPAWMLIRRSE